MRLIASNPDGQELSIGIYEAITIESPTLDIETDAEYILVGWEGSVPWWNGDSRYWTEPGKDIKYTKLEIKE